jgi:hypothetical protein
MMQKITVVRLSSLALIAPVVLFAMVPALFAQQPASAPSDDHQLVMQLLQRVNELEAEVQRLRSAQPNGAAVPNAIVAGVNPEQTAPAPVAVSTSAGGMPGMSVSDALGLQFRGFADTLFTDSTQKGTHSTFSEGMGDAGNTIGFRLIQFPQPLGSWSEHVVSWLDDSGMPIHRVRYEDLLAEPAAELAKVAVFLGMSPDGAPGAAAATQFENLRAQEEERGFRDLIYETRFFRQGRVGGWRSALSAAQVERIERDHGEVMARLGYL